MARQRITYNVGDIFYTKWGYEQTNVDFYQVVKTTARTVWLQPIGKKVNEKLSAMSNKVEPCSLDLEKYEVTEHTNELVMKRINRNYNDLLTGSNSWDFYYLYKEKPLYESSYA